MFETEHLRTTTNAAMSTTSVNSGSNTSNNNSNNNSSSNSNSNNEHLALVRFANRLRSNIVNDNDAEMLDEGDVRKEARLLMSLSCGSSTNSCSRSCGDSHSGTTLQRHHHHGHRGHHHQHSQGSRGGTMPTTVHVSRSGRSTPESGYSSSSSASSFYRRETFHFTCPSLSLTDEKADANADAVNADAADGNARIRTQKAAPSNERCPNVTHRATAPPAKLLKRPLKVDDRDALRLSARAMTRNIMESFHRAAEWRMKSWAAVLSRRLVEAERRLGGRNAPKKEIRQLLQSGEARLILHLRRLMKALKVTDATTSFKVKGRVQTEEIAASAPPTKRRRLSAAQGWSDDAPPSSSLAEAEYTYDVAHALVMDCNLNIITPAGNVQIELEVPGTITGTFQSAESTSADLHGVDVDLDTSILASMIEKSCRTVVRASVEALLKQDHGEAHAVPPQQEQKQMASQPAGKKVSAMAPAKHGNTKPHSKRKPKSKSSKRVTTPATTPLRSATPQRAITSDRINFGTIVTPRDSSSPVYATDSDPEERPVLLAIPTSFASGTRRSINGSKSLSMISPHPQRTRHFPERRDQAAASAPASSQYGGSKFAHLVSPQPKPPRETIHATQEDGPDLPTLVEVACAAMQTR